eukprot:gnl/TRDRNA2_/TRDRNA2_177654_c1_seq9.p1 gnl/TRDRNA2_/TRDRNA2_177654_c1~~gnl/TRDRNA2_/TRDRNA2_177654_c1_seq9.p1  ORF type:complete len:191 (+),score=22.24 gnl/TRDRNA2_/TRDRNA2_177654_c1_seq9:74-646(+)
MDSISMLWDRLRGPHTPRGTSSGPSIPPPKVGCIPNVCPPIAAPDPMLVETTELTISMAQRQEDLIRSVEARLEQRMDMVAEKLLKQQKEFLETLAARPGRVPVVLQETKTVVETTQGTTVFWGPGPRPPPTDGGGQPAAWKQAEPTSGDDDRAQQNRLGETVGGLTQIFVPPSDQAGENQQPAEAAGGR